MIQNTNGYQKDRKNLIAQKINIQMVVSTDICAMLIYPFNQRGMSSFRRRMSRVREHFSRGSFLVWEMERSICNLILSSLEWFWFDECWDQSHWFDPRHQSKLLHLAVRQNPWSTLYTCYYCSKRGYNLVWRMWMWWVTSKCIAGYSRLKTGYSNNSSVKLSRMMFAYNSGTKVEAIIIYVDNIFSILQSLNNSALWVHMWMGSMMITSVIYVSSWNQGTSVLAVIFPPSPSDGRHTYAT